MNQRARIQRLKPERTSPFLLDFSFLFFVRVEEQWRPRSYLILMKELVERPILSDSSSSSRTPSFRLRGLTKHTHFNTHMNRHSLTHTHSSVQRFKEDLWPLNLSPSDSHFISFCFWFPDLSSGSALLLSSSSFTPSFLPVFRCLSFF